MNRLGKIKVSYEFKKNFDALKTAFTNCVPIAIDDNEFYQMTTYTVATNFLPELKEGDLIPEYFAQIETVTRKNVTLISLVEFMSGDGRKYIAYKHP